MIYTFMFIVSPLTSLSCSVDTLPILLDDGLMSGAPWEVCLWNLPAEGKRPLREELHR